MATCSSAGARSAQRSPPSQAPEVISESVVGTVSAGGASVTTGAGGRFSPHAASRSAAPRRALGSGPACGEM